MHILAKIDALFLNPREYHHGGAFLPNALAEIYRRREEFLTGAGVSVEIGGDANERKAGERLLSELAEVGAVEILKTSGRRSGVRLTERGEFVARRLVAADDVVKSWPVLVRLVDLIDESPLVYAGERWVREQEAAEVLDQSESPGERVAGLEFRLLPLKARGLVTDNVDCHGRVSYAMKENGRAAALRDAPPIPGELPEMNEDLAEGYTELLKAFANERNEWRCDIPGRLHIPLPVAFP